MKAVIDTSILISAFLTHHDSPPRLVYKAILADQFTLVSSVATLEELENVLNRDAIAQLHRLTPDEVGEVVDNLATISEIVPGVVTVRVVKDDPADDIFIAAAVDGHADYIVSGDKHLLSIREYAGIEIVTARQFVAALNSSL
jgi:uncharacterized protein